MRAEAAKTNRSQPYATRSVHCACVTGTAVIQMVLNDFFVIQFDVGAQPQYQNEFRAFLGAALEGRRQLAKIRRSCRRLT